MYLMGYEIKFLPYSTTHVNMKKDIDLVFWDIK